jgi:hypothetical protein
MLMSLGGNPVTIGTDPEELYQTPLAMRGPEPAVLAAIAYAALVIRLRGERASPLTVT